MWHWVAESLEVRRARKAAVATISPIVEHSRRTLGGISETVWSDPYIIGFILMLISVVAKLESQGISENALSRIQRKAWNDITSAPGSAAAEQLVLLNSLRNRDFELGCQNAAAFSSILFGTAILLEGGRPPIPDVISESASTQREDVNLAWVQFFDVQIWSRSGLQST
jgi:hypothetical protein